MIKILPPPKAKASSDDILQDSIKECNDTLEACKGIFQDVIVLGYDAKTNTAFSMATGVFADKAETLWIIKKFERFLLSDEEL